MGFDTERGGVSIEPQNEATQRAYDLLGELRSEASYITQKMYTNDFRIDFQPGPLNVDVDKFGRDLGNMPAKSALIPEANQ